MCIMIKSKRIKGPRYSKSSTFDTTGKCHLTWHNKNGGNNGSTNCNFTFNLNYSAVVYIWILDKLLSCLYR